MMLSRRFLVLAACVAPGVLHGARAQDAVMPAPGKRDWAAQIPQLRIGLLGGENEADRLGRYGAYQKLLEDTFQVPVRLYMAADYGGVAQAFAARQVELSYMSPAAYAATWMESDGNVEPVLVAKEEDGSTSYIAAMYVRADSNIRSIEDMRGRAMAWGDPNSASGYLIPRAELREAGINPDTYFGRSGFAGGYEQAVIAVLQGQYDAGVSWTSGVGDASRGYSRGGLRAMVDKGMLNMADLRIIWRSKPIQNGPLVLRRDLPAAFRQDMIAFHMAMPPDVYRAITRGNGTGWAPTQHAAYQIFIDLRRAEASNRRNR